MRWDVIKEDKTYSTEILQPKTTWQALKHGHRKAIAQTTAPLAG